ncbi:hypothetical protein ACA910_015579 [Epithemia clementina (nom. ined.)]
MVAAGGGGGAWAKFVEDSPQAVPTHYYYNGKNQYVDGVDNDQNVHSPPRPSPPPTGIPQQQPLLDSSTSSSTTTTTTTTTATCQLDVDGNCVTLSSASLDPSEYKLQPNFAPYVESRSDLPTSDDASSPRFAQCQDRLGPSICYDMIRDLTALLATNSGDDDDDDNDEAKQDSNGLVANTNHTCIRLFGTLYYKCQKTCRMCDSIKSTRSGTNDDGKNVLFVSSIYNDFEQEIPVFAPNDHDQTDDLQRALDEYHAYWKVLSDADEYMYRDVYVNGEINKKQMAAAPKRTRRQLHQSSSHDNVDGGVETYPLSTRLQCRNRDALCTVWAAEGECDANPSYMHLHCAPACRTCPFLDFQHRCGPPLTLDGDGNNNTAAIWSKAGDLHRTFVRIVETAEYKDKYQPQILSHPALYRPNQEDNNNNYGDDGEEDGPWVVLLDHFLTPTECEILIALGAEQGYERSEDVSDVVNFDGTYGSRQSEGRTSTNAWCTDDCWNNSTVQTIHERIQELLQIPPNHYEFLQLLRYQVGQFYTVHHDYIEHELTRPQGPRILTIFLYLNDVEEGGGTNFPDLDPPLTVQPKQGRAVLWPSVLDENPMAIDDRTHHQALPVTAGIKYGANAWVHQGDFKASYERNCQ